MPTSEQELEEALIEKLRSLKYEYRPDFRDRTALEIDFREKFEAFNRVTLTPGEFSRLPEEIITLSGLEAQVAAQTQKLDALKTQKKGLMQQLFPSPEAVA